MTGEEFLPEKDLLEQDATTKKIEYLSLGNKLKKQTSIAKKEYQESDRL